MPHEKICVLNKHGSAMTYGAVGCGFNINEITVHMKIQCLYTEIHIKQGSVLISSSRELRFAGA